MSQTIDRPPALAVILARGGSKRIPGKNIIPFHGRPMLGWPVSCAQDSGLFQDIIVSTDSAEIAETAKQEGAQVPFLRPAALADDHTPARAVINHAILTQAEGSGRTPEYICCLYGTAAFARPNDLQSAFDLLRQNDDTPFVFAATTFAHPVQRAIIETPEGLEMLFPQHAATRTQDMPEAFHDVGMFYWGRRDAFLDNLPMFGARSRPFLLPRLQAVDIDTPEDWDAAEALFSLMQNGPKGR